MGIAKIIQLQSLISSSSTTTSYIIIIIINISENSMSQEYHHHQQQQPQQNPTNQQQEETTHVSGLFGFQNGFDRSTDDPSTSSVVADLNPGYDQSAGMLSEMFNFGQGSGTGNANQSQIPPSELLDYRRTGSGILVGNNNEWYEEQQHQPHPHHHQHEQHNQLNDHNSAAAMQLFITNAPPRSPSPPPPQQPPFHSMGIVNTPNNSNNPNFWGGHRQLSGIIEGQGLSLSLSSSLQHLEAAKQAEDNQIMFFNSAVGPSSVTTNDASLSHTHFFKNLSNSQPPTPHPQHHHHNPVILQNLQPVGGYVGPSSGSIGFGSVGSTSSSLGVVNVLRNSKYSKPAQELLEEFCSVGRGHQLKKPNNKLGRQNSSNNPNSSTSGGGSGGGAGGSSSSKEPPQLAPSDRIEHQRRKVKLLAMLDEVDRRYNHYCEQMQMVVNSFDLVMGYGGAIPYTALAQKAMSRHFRCLKDAIHAQVKHSCELLGEKDPTASSGLTKGETPRLKALEQSLRQQRAFHQMGMMDQEAWRPQRGLPERSVNILRAWLFEHFLHPYPSDADKHLLARQTGLSRNQVSNWFINARVRLWKPMVEEMYQQEAKDREDNNDNDNNNDNDVDDNDDDNNEEEKKSQHPLPITQTPMPSSSTSASTSTMLSNEPQKSAIDTKHPTLLDSDPSQLAPINNNNRLPNQQQHLHFHSQRADVFELPDSGDAGPATMIRFGGPAPTGDVSLTLGLRHSGNAPEKGGPFSVRDFGS